MRRPGAAHSVAWKHHKRETQLGSSIINIDKYTHLHINLVLTGDSPGTQLNLSFMMFLSYWMCCTRTPRVSLGTRFEISRFIINERFSWVPVESPTRPNLLATECFSLNGIVLGLARASGSEF
ncbi:hypothetical protein CSKR_107306 [Clonorchis sinensis]|uniref:Uncharacterized protein n=1 Tax=Clonorchis sinensis TaxID=79923 RepID=A0A419Q2K9_CLOSI|nr:hypothetical protein CSKR_107306 [Clonorchis sinensis]